MTQQLIQRVSNVFTQAAPGVDTPARPTPTIPKSTQSTKRKQKARRDDAPVSSMIQPGLATPSNLPQR